MKREFISGRNFEERLRTKLETLGCVIEYESVFDHRYKLDFVINRFREIDRLTHVGVQITVNGDDFRKQQEFVTIQKAQPLVPKSVYIELSGDADIERGAAVVVYAAIIGFAFSRTYQEQRVIGLRIFEDFSYEFFDLEENIQGLRKQRQSPQEVKREKTSPALTGKIVRYVRDRGFGFIESPGHPDFFFHIYNVDEEVKAQIEDQASAWSGSGTVILNPSIPVVFKDEGYTKPNAPHPNAIDVEPWS